MIGWIALAAIQQAQLTRQLEQHAERNARERLTPEQFQEWKRERTEERRHQELCQAIRDTGRKPRWW